MPLCRGFNLTEFMDAPDATSTRPYLVRALYEWCTDNGLTPYVAVAVDSTVQVPREYVKNNEIVLNISFDATSSLKLSNECIEFKARFAGSARDIMVPMSRVIAIYARENGQGMAFPLADAKTDDEQTPISSARTQVAMPVTPALVPTVSPFLVPTASDSKIVQLVPSDGTGATSEGDPEPPNPPKPKGPRPSLKRVK